MSLVDRLDDDSARKGREPRTSVEAAMGFPPRRPPTAVGIIDRGGPPSSVEPSREWYTVSYWRHNESMVLQHGVLSRDGRVVDVDATLVLSLEERFLGLAYEFQAAEFIGKVDTPSDKGNLVRRILTLRSFGRFHFIDDTYRSCVLEYLERLNPGGKSAVNVPYAAGVMDAPKKLMEILRY